MRRSTLALFLIASWSAASAAEGLVVDDGQLAWPKWQARLSLTIAPAARFALNEPTDGAATGRAPVRGAILLGDYYFASLKALWLAPHGGFRATSGLMFGTRTLAVAESTAAGRAGSRLSLAVQLSRGAPETGNGTVPYLGIGYTGLSLKGGWGFSADFGLTAENPAGAMRFGRALFGTQGVESALRELRLSPLLQLGVSYSF